MNFILQPWQLFLIILASWSNREQQQRIDYLETQCAVLIEHIGNKRILLTDDQRRRIAVKGKTLGRKALSEIGSLFTPDTILRWHRQLVANKWDYSDRKEKKLGRPRTRQVIVDLVVKFAKENPSWGYDRINGAISNLGYNICDSSGGHAISVMLLHGGRRRFAALMSVLYCPKT
jgi:putative transposase